MGRKSLEAEYGIEKKHVDLHRRKTKSKKVLEVFANPGEGVHVEFEFPEFTCKCPRTGHPDFATIVISYTPDKWCVEMKSLKYYYNSFRDEGHFHEQVSKLMAEDLVGVLKPLDFCLLGKFNARGGTTPTIRVSYYVPYSGGKGHWG